MRCFRCDEAQASAANTLCQPCMRLVSEQEQRAARAFRQRFEMELRLKMLLCDGSGWPAGTSAECRDWFIVQWPGYTPAKEYANTIAELWGRPVPYPGLCHCSLEQGRAVNARFERVCAA